MEIFEWEDGIKTADGYVTINGQRYTITMPTYTGETPVSADNLNQMQRIINSNIKDYYSTNEKLIGEWIDGKPIFRKVVSTGSLPNNTKKYVAHGLSGVKFTKVYGIASDSASTLILPRPHTDPNLSITLDIIGSNIVITDKSNLSSFQSYVVLEYTKN